MESFAGRLKKAMEMREMSQLDLADRSGVSQPTISAYLNSKNEPRAKYLAQLAYALDVNEAWLMGYDVEIERRSGILYMYQRLDKTDRIKAEAYIEGLLAADKYRSNLQQRPV